MTALMLPKGGEGLLLGHDSCTCKTDVTRMCEKCALKPHESLSFCMQFMAFRELMESKDNVV